VEASARNPLEVRPRGTVANAIVACAYIGLYELAALWGKEVSAHPGSLPGVAPWFPAAGLTVALLVGFGLRWAPAAFVAELISGPVIFEIDKTFTTGQIVLNAAALTAAYMAGAYVLRRVLRIDTSLRDIRSLIWLLIIGVGATPLVAALAGVGMRVWAGADPASDYFDLVRTWWVGDAIGIASVTPAVLTIGSALINHQRPRLGAHVDRLRDALQAVIVVASPFVLYALQGSHHTLLFLSAFPVIWVAVTRGFLITTVAVLYTNVACTAAAHWQGLGPLDLADVQTFMLTLAVMSLGVAGATRELRRSKAALAYRATHDELTRLPNRSAFFAALREALESGKDVAVLFFDVDRLRIVGDSLGFEVMDQLLAEVGERVSNAVGRGNVVSRYGGDEFAVLICGRRVEHRGREAADRIASVLHTPFQLKRQEVIAPTSVGVATGGPGDEPGKLLRRADLARAEAKRRGAGCWVAFDEAIGRAVRERLSLERDLSSALERGEMAVAFQPIFSLAEREVVYVESLVRWRHPERGAVSPGEFIPVAEEIGLVPDICRFVLEAACRHAATWPATSDAGPPLVTVNVSVAQLGDEALLRDVARALERSGLPPGRLALEITESMGLADPDATVEFLRRLCLLGIELMIDDFGAGYSSLGHLHRLPVSVVKADQMFTKQLGFGSPGETVIASVVQLARGLGLRVVAEGAETEEQLVHLRRLGCDAAQGYGLARPCDPDELDRLLGERARSLTTSLGAERLSASHRVSRS
jgi:diguanylate cyclase (GGDEF)-like protein